ncbi:hypothetical protein [Caulobacter sp.]|uniref:hypothetical protein n=1 Tax=Caulobacter sp. TaxID=78 RepID=UPI003BAE8E92
MEALAAALEASPLGVWARGSNLAYPVANLIHLLGLVMLIGGIGVLDLRLVGAFRRLPVEVLWRCLLPPAIAGLVLLVPAGFVMFAADASSLVVSTVFRWKVALIALALANAGAYHLLWRRRLALWDVDPPLGGRIMAAGSLALWLVITALGRWIAYA